MSGPGDIARYNMADVFAMGFGASRIPIRYDIKTGTEDTDQPKYAIERADDREVNFDFSGLKRIGADEVTVGTSWLGTPINFKFALAGGTYQYYVGGQIKTKTVAEFQMPIATMVELTLSKRDRITPMNGGIGSVKELYAFEDWHINISGICLYDPSHPQAVQPIGQRNRLAEFNGLADTVELVRDDGLFTDLGIYGLYIHSIRFGQVTGKPNQIPFTMECLSDVPIEWQT